MAKREIEADSITLDFYCDRCERKATDVPLQECIYCGPPVCTDCGGIDMSLDKVYIEK